jgi:putative redox protein
MSTAAPPSAVEHVTHNFAPALAAIEDAGEAEVTLGGKRYTIRRQLLEDLRLHDIEARVADLKRALLVLHAPRDEVVGVEHATRIFVAAKHPKSFVSLDTADHYLARAADADYAASVIAAWAERYIAPGAAG